MNESVPLSLEHAGDLSLTPEECFAVRMALQARMTLSLSPEEKTDIRRTLQHAVYAEPAPVAAVVWSWRSIGMRIPATLFSVLLLLGVSGGGLAYAAEGALPGDPLYGVKVYVNEAVFARMQFTPEARVHWALKRLERRMDELRRLEARGVANDEIDVAIGDVIEETAHHVEVEVQALPAAAAERAASRTAVNAAIGDDQDSMRRASRINHVLKALKERADEFDVPPPSTIAPVPSVNAHMRDDEDEKQEDEAEAEVEAEAEADDDDADEDAHEPDDDLEADETVDGDVEVKL